MPCYVVRPLCFVAAQKHKAALQFFVFDTTELRIFSAIKPRSVFSALILPNVLAHPANFYALALSRNDEVYVRVFPIHQIGFCA